MEHQNMMPNGMGGGNNMNMAMNSMQRPQSGNQGQQIHAAIMEHLRMNLGRLPQGWQQTFDIRERANRIMQMVTQLRFLDNSFNKCVTVAEGWEQKTIAECPNKEHYFAQWGEKLAEITRKRTTNAAQNGLGGMPQNNMGNMHNMNMPQNAGVNGMNGMNAMNGMGGMNMNFNGMGGMNMPNGGGMPNQMNMGPQGGFPQQLQRQMQPSPMPPQNGSIDPSALTQNPQMQNHMPNQMSQPTPQQRQQQQQNINPNQGGPPNVPSDNEVKQLAKRMYDSTSEEQKKQLRAQFINNLTNEQKQMFQSRQMDPLNQFFMQRARDTLVKRRQQQSGGIGQMGGNQMQQNPSQSGQQGFDFSSMVGQQANAMKAQESGGEVVPASNNNNNVMQQGGNNQQPINFNQGGGTSNQQMVQFAAMQEKQKREQMAKKNQLAQQQAMAQQNQLRGQPGGLNAPNALNGGQVNSPAMNMNMLNRPTFPPGQATPSTPHQNMQNQPPQTPSTGANQLQQHHQNMLNQNQIQPGLDLQPGQRQFMSSLPPEAQQKLASLPPAQVTKLLERYAAQRQGVMMPPGGPPNNQNPGMGPGGQGQAMQNQPSMGRMGNAGPGFNGQPLPNQQGGMEQQPGYQQKLQQHQQASLKLKAMDIRPFPKQVLATLALSVPDFVNSWGKLKQHISQNQGVLPQGLMDRLNGMQSQWFDTHPEELKLAVEQFKQMLFAQSNAQRQGQAGPAQQQGGPQGMPMPNGQAPQAQMVAPPAQMQQPAQNQGMNEQHIPQENINMLRAKNPAAKNMTDDQIREMMRRRRAGQVAQANQDMQQNLRNAQMNAQATQRAQQMMAGGAQAAPQQQGGHKQQQGQQQGQGQKRGNSDDVVEIPNPNAPRTGQQPPQQNQQQRPMPQMPNVPGLKSREELVAMPHEQRNAYMRRVQEMQALRKAQIGISANAQQQNVPQQQAPPQQTQQQGQQAAAPNQPTQEMQQQLMRIRQIYAEVQGSSAKGPEVQLDQRSMQQAKDLLKKLYPIANTLDKTLIAGFRAFGEDRVREAIKIKQIILQNVSNAEGDIPDYLGVSLETLKRSEHFIGIYLKELKARQQAQQQQQQSQSSQDAGKQAQANAQAAAPQQKQAQQPPGKQAPPAGPQKGQPPLNRKNSSQHARKASQNKAPPAPTENKTFDWASPTPHGVPKYDPGRTELTADKLKFPPQKKRKTTDSQDSTPAAQTGTPGPTGASPQVTSGPKRESPEQVRRMPPQQQQEPEKPRFVCDDMFCPASTQGFESDEQLKKHKEEEHKVIEDPFKFLMDTVSTGLTAMGGDQNGNKLPVKANTQAVRRPPAAQRVADRKAAASVTPALKAESATPATPASSGKSAVKTGLATPAGGKKAEEVKAQDAEKTLYDTLVDQMGIELPSTSSAPKSIAAATADEQDPWMKNLADALDDFDTTAAATSNDDLDDWSNVDFDAFAVPRESNTVLSLSSDTESSPELTPASSVASQNSEVNISEAQRLKMIFEWDPSGNGDAAVPERLGQMCLAEEAGDTEMGEGGQASKTDKWDWSGDFVDWDSLFGAGSGLDGDDGGFAAALEGYSG